MVTVGSRWCQSKHDAKSNNLIIASCQTSIGKGVEPKVSKMQCKDSRLKQKDDKIRVPKRPYGRNKCREKNKVKKVRTPRRNYQVLLDELRQKGALTESDLKQTVTWNNSVTHHPYSLGDIQTCESYAPHPSPAEVGITGKDPAPYYVQTSLVQTNYHPGSMQCHPVPTNEGLLEEIEVSETTDCTTDLIHSWPTTTSSLGCIPSSLTYPSAVMADSVQVVQHHAGNEFRGKLVPASNESMGQPVPVPNDSDYGSVHLQTSQRCAPYMGHPGAGETWNNNPAVHYPPSMQMVPALTDGNQRFMQYHTIPLPPQTWRVTEPAANRPTVYSLNRTDENVSPAVTGWFGKMDAQQSTISSLGCMPISTTCPSSLMADSGTMVQHHAGGQQVPASNVSDYGSAHLQTSQGCATYLGHPGAGVTWNNNPAAHYPTPIHMVPANTDEHQRFMNSHPTPVPLQNGRFPEPAAKRPTVYSLNRTGETISPAFCGSSGYMNAPASNMVVQYYQQQLVPAQDTCMWYHPASTMSNPGPNLVAESWNNNPGQYCPPMHTIPAHTNGYQGSMQFHPVDPKPGPIPVAETSTMAQQAPPPYVSAYKCDEQTHTEPMGQPVLVANNSHYGSVHLQTSQRCAPYMGHPGAGETWNNNPAQYCPPMHTVPAHTNGYQGSMQFHPVEPKPGPIPVAETSTMAQQAPPPYVSAYKCDEHTHTDLMGQPVPVTNESDYESVHLQTSQRCAPYMGHPGAGETWNNNPAQYCPPMHTIPHANGYQGSMQFHPVEPKPGPIPVAETSTMAQQAPPPSVSAYKCDEQTHTELMGQPALVANDSHYGSVHLQTSQRYAPYMGHPGAGETWNNNPAQYCPPMHTIPAHTNGHQGSMQFHPVEPKPGPIPVAETSMMVQQAPPPSVSAYKCDEQTHTELMGQPVPVANESDYESVHLQTSQRCALYMGHPGAGETWINNPAQYCPPMHTIPAHTNGHQGSMQSHPVEPKPEPIPEPIPVAETSMMAQQGPPPDISAYKCDEQTHTEPMQQPVPVANKSDYDFVHLKTSPGAGETLNNSPDQDCLPMNTTPVNTNGLQEFMQIFPFFPDFSCLSDPLSYDPTKPGSIHIFETSKMEEQSPSPCGSDECYDKLSKLIEEHLDQEQCLPT